VAGYGTPVLGHAANVPSAGLTYLSVPLLTSHFFYTAGFINIRRDVDGKFFRYRYARTRSSCCGRHIAQPSFNLVAWHAYSPYY
jgi:hypothetical protein